MDTWSTKYCFGNESQLIMANRESEVEFKSRTCPIYSSNVLKGSVDKLPESVRVVKMLIQN